MKRQSFLWLLLVYGGLSLFLAATTPISPHEAKNFYTPGFVSLLMHTGSDLLPGFLGLRIFFLLSAFLSIRIFYELNQRYFSKQEDVYFSTALFMFLPGILTATALANIGIIVLCLVLLFVLFYEHRYYLPLPLIMIGLFFIHEASIIFFTALFFYGISYKDKRLMIVSSAFIIAFVYLSKGIEIGGRPTGHFIEIFGLYAAVFSPLLFIYFFYTMYRILLRGKRTLMWYISFTALAVSLLLSLRQKVYITDFAPYVMISTISMVDVFMRSLRVRLPQFRMRYLGGMYIVVAVVVLSMGMIAFNKILFTFTKTHRKPFAYRIYRPYFLSNELRSKGIQCYDAKGRNKLQLRYYGINPCSVDK
jgi:hypothetical protein